MEYNSTTTLNRIREGTPESGRACESSWKKLLASQGKTKGDDEPIDLLTVWDALDYDDALWVLSYGMPDDRLARHFQAWCAEQVLHLFEVEFPDDKRPRDQISMLRNDNATGDEQTAARDAAWDAAWAARAARATRAAACAAWAAACAAWAAAGAAWAAAGAAARAAQESQLRKMLVAA